MGYKQPGFGNGEKAPTVHSSPLNIRSRKKRREQREKEGRVSQKSDILISENQYKGKTNKQIKKLREKAAKRANKAETRAAEGKKLSKRQQDAIAERDYNLKRDKQLEQHKTRKAKLKEEYGGSYGAKTRERMDQKRMEKDYQERQVAEADASANRFRDPALVASENRDPSETNMPDVDLVSPKKKDPWADTKIMNKERSEQAGVRINYSPAELKERAQSAKPNKYGETPIMQPDGSFKYEQRVPKWVSESKDPAVYEKWSADLDKLQAQKDIDYEAQFGSDAGKTGERDYTQLEGYNTWGRTRKQKNRELREGYAAGTLSPGQMARQDRIRKEKGFKKDPKTGRYTISTSEFISG
jgi:hypothetical protein